MTDAHCHVRGAAARHFLASPCEESPGAGDFVFVGTHPWCAEDFDAASLESRLRADLRAGVGEIGLDRLRARTVSQRMREVFEAQLRIASAFGRPVVLHGAKCWGEVVKTIRRLGVAATEGGGVPAFLFHGFSRSDGLLPDIAALGGFVSVGPAVLNDHAVNYRELVKKVPPERLLVETDRTPEHAAETPALAAVAAKLAELVGLSADALDARLEENAAAFVRGL